MNWKKTLKLLRNKRALSPVISSVILIGAVIAVSFVVLVWAQYRASSYNEEYSEAMNSDIARLKERLIFEYIFYNAGAKNLIVYIMNCGTIDNVTVQTVFVSYDNGTLLKSFPSVSLLSLKDSTPITQGLSRGDEGYFTLSLSPHFLESNETYYIKIITERGSTFETTFIA